MIKIAQIIYVIAAMAMFMYFIFSFVLMDIDASNWSEGQRAFCVILWAICMSFAVCVAGVSGYFEDKRP